MGKYFAAFLGVILCTWTWVNWTTDVTALNSCREQVTELTLKHEATLNQLNKETAVSLKAMAELSNCQKWFAALDTESAENLVGKLNCEEWFAVRDHEGTEILKAKLSCEKELRVCKEFFVLRDEEGTEILKQKIHCEDALKACREKVQPTNGGAGE